MLPRSARPQRAVPAGQQGQEDKPASTEVGDSGSDPGIEGEQLVWVGHGLVDVGRGVVLWAGAWSCGRGMICGWGPGLVDGA